MIIDLARKQDWVPRSTRKNTRDIEDAVTTLYNKLGYYPSIQEVTEYLNITPEKYQDTMRKASLFNILSLDMVLAEAQGNEISMKLPQVETNEQPENQFLKKEITEVLAEGIKKLKENIDVMTLTATPIPRTLHMSLIGIRDMSVLEEPPVDRLPIQTYVMEYNDEMVREAISRELARNGQVYYVYNRVKGIDEIAAHIQELVKDAVVVYAHGQMQERQLEKIMYDFVSGEIDVLVSTTIIETGLDIPNANTMIIHDADRMGLSQLYQLRGRVGRSNRTSYAFLMYKRDKLLREEAEKRLQAIREFTELGSGIKIAMRDLEIRGAGNVLGAEQHGHMIYLPHGAILGLDGIFDGRSELTEVTVETIKSPASLGRADTEYTVLYEGPTRKATELYPRNVNVHAAIALAGIGFDKTHSKIIADPSVNTNTHLIHLVGKGIDFTIRVSSFSEGGVTGKYTPLSACGSLDRVLGGSGFQFV